MLLAMKRLLSKQEGVELVGSFRNAAEALDFVRDHPVDMAFLDIEIGDDNGLELAQAVRSLCVDADIVFTTSHTEYAMPAYDVYPLDYMVKPISGVRLEQTIARAVGRRGSSLGDADGRAAQPPANADVDAAQRLAVRGLGGFEVSSRQAGEVKWISKRSAELFAYLLVHRGRNVTRARILEDMFPEMPLRNAELYLNTAAYQLRKALSLHGFKESILSTQEQYRVDLNRIDVDFIQFEQGAEELSEIRAENEAAALKLELQFQGELFEDCPYEWATAERERLAIAYVSFAKTLIKRLFDRKRYREAELVARRLISRNEFDEQSNLLLLTVLGATGDRQSLHRFYESYTQSLRQELDLAPSEKLRRIYEQYR